MTYEPSAELSNLLGALLDDEITVDESDRLAEILSADIDARDFYRELIETHSMMIWQRRAVAVPDDSYGDRPVLAPGSDPIAVASLSSNRGVRTPDFAINPIPHFAAFGYFSSGWPVAYVIATVLLGVGLTIAALIRVSPPRDFAAPSPSSLRDPSLKSQAPDSSSVVGRITGMVDCVWGGTEDGVQGAGAANRNSEIRVQKSLLHLGDRLALRSGLLEITYDTGARVILQGPVVYEVESSAGGYLSVGKLTAELEKRSEAGDQRSESANQKSELSNHQFVVRTPTAIVTDLGTEFGVEVDKQGGTTSHVFRGSVRVQRLSADGSGADPGQVLRESQSASVAGDGAREISVVQSVKPSAFVRKIPKQAIITTFDLVDVVAGGNGFSGRRNRGIDSTTGQPIGWAVSQLGHFPIGDGRYHRPEAMPFVDGVFVPDGRNGAVQLDSAGHAFGEFVTNTKEAGRYIWAGGAILGNDSTPSPKVDTRLGDVDFASDGHCYLFLASNNGITFDLQAIRLANPGCTLLRFHAVAGNSERDSRDKNAAVYADLHVFVDGQIRFRRREINGYSGVFSIVIPIGQNDRYLTLTSTDAGNGIACDDILFGDPRLEMRNENSPVPKTRESQQRLSKENSN